MGFFSAVKKVGKTVANNPKLKKLAVAGAVAAGSSLGGPVGGIVAGSVANSALKGSNTKKSKQAKAKAVGAATASGGSTAVALADSGPSTQYELAPQPQNKGFLSRLFALFGG